MAKYEGAYNLRTLFIVFTYYQLLTVIQLRLTEFSKGSADLLLTDNSKGYFEVAEKLRTTGLFDEVITADCSKLLHFDSLKQEVRTGFDILIDDNSKSVDCCSKNLKDSYYDSLAFFNYHYFTLSLFFELKRNNDKMVCYRFEEGFTSYFSERQYLTRPANLQLKIADALKRPSPINSLKAMYCFRPELIMFEPLDCQVLPITPLSKTETSFTSYVNTIFDVNERWNCSGKIIFFEEAFCEDGIDIGDYELVDSLAKRYGDRFMLKPHPRIKTNRFEDKDIRVCPNSSAPWEVLLLNATLDGTIFLTISSGSVISPRLLMDLKIPTLMLCNCTSNRSPIATRNFDRFISCMSKDDQFFIPGDYDNACSTIDRLLID